MRTAPNSSTGLVKLRNGRGCLTSSEPLATVARPLARRWPVSCPRSGLPPGVIGGCVLHDGCRHGAFPDHAPARRCVRRSPHSSTRNGGAHARPTLRSFSRADDRGVVAFDAAVGNRPGRLVAITDSGFPAVYERIPLFATLRAQLAWLLGMALVFLYAAVWRPIAAVVHGPSDADWDSRRWSTWLAGVASALNLLFLLGFPIAFLGRLEGGVPEFVYGVPVVAARLLLIPPVTAAMAIAVSIAVVRIWRDGRASAAGRLAHSLVAIALLSFVVFAWYWP